MAVTPSIVTAKVKHKRLHPVINAFSYNIYYIILPITRITPKMLKPLSFNAWSILSFYSNDHNNKQGNMRAWIDDILHDHQLQDVVDEVMLLTMPRILGYVFNPVSFWLCCDKDGHARAILCEVNNTFGERHNYLCLPKKTSIITADEWLEAEKIFHVSPFLPREGSYKFKFSINKKTIGIWINYYGSNGVKQLTTSLTGTLSPFTRYNVIKSFFMHPFMTLKVVMLIHWHALKLLTKGVQYITKPKTIDDNISNTK